MMHPLAIGKKAKNMRGSQGIKTKSMVLMVFVCVLTGACVSLLIIDHILWENVSQAPMRTFQRMVGGLGMGAISTPVWNFINFDPRIMSVDDSILWPIAAGYPYGPDRTGTVTYFQEIPKNQIIISENQH